MLSLCCLLLLFGHPAVFSSLRPHGLQHARPRCPSPSPEACPSSCPLPQWCHPAISSSDAPLLPSVFSSIKDFSNESAVCIRWPKYWSFSFSTFSTYNEYSGIISLKIDWLDLLSVQGTLRSLLQHHSSRTSILQCSVFFTVQLSQLNVTTGKTLALTVLIFVGRVMSLLFNTLSRFVIAFMPKNKHLLISWLQSPYTAILEPKKRKSVTASTLSLSICHEAMGSDAMILVFLIFN